MDNTKININDVIPVFKKIARKTGWKISKSYNYYELMTDLPITVENKTYYVNVIARQWSTDDAAWFSWSFANAPMSQNGTSRLRYKGKLVKEWEMPCNFNDIKEADEYIETLTKFVAKKNTNFNKNANKTQTNFDEQRVTYKAFYNKMEELAEQNDVNFTEDKNGLKKWEFDDVTISWSNKEKCWRVVIRGLNYSYFRCKNLNGVVDLVEWYLSFPNDTVKYSLKF